MEILVATGNKNKFSELQAVAATFGHTLHMPGTLRDAHQLPPVPEVVEDGDDYLTNARKKAVALHAWSKMPTLADDSGLEVDALGGRPGVRSARYGGPGLSDRDRCALLQQEVAAALEANPVLGRAARFVCVLCLTGCLDEVGEPEMVSQGELSGVVLEEFRGERGFGYDPIIEINEFGRTLAEVSFERVAAEGFRARATKTLFERLAEVQAGR